MTRNVVVGLLRFLGVVFVAMALYAYSIGDFGNIPTWAGLAAVVLAWSFADQIEVLPNWKVKAYYGLVGLVAGFTVLSFVKGEYETAAGGLFMVVVMLLLRRMRPKPNQ